MEQKQVKAKNILYVIVIALAVASLLFKGLVLSNLEQTSILFVGVPTLITLLVIKNMSKPSSLYGIVFLVITLFLLVCCIFFGEGLVCILFMAPIFYGIGALIVAIYNSFKNTKNKTLKSIIVLPLFMIVLQPQDALLKLETQTVKTSITIDEKVSFDLLNKTPDFQKNLPDFFKLGFPKPIGVRGKGLELGSKRTIQFKSNTKGIGELILSVKELDSNRIKFDIISDNTHINHWLTWKNIEVELIEKNKKTEIIWITHFTCDLGPQWYFEPLEKYAVKKMNQHLLRSFFINKVD